MKQPLKKDIESKSKDLSASNTESSFDSKVAQDYNHLDSNTGQKIQKLDSATKNHANKTTNSSSCSMALGELEGRSYLNDNDYPSNSLNRPNCIDKGENLANLYSKDSTTHTQQSIEKDLQTLRQNIDSIDKEIIQLLDKRLTFVQQIGHLKVKNNASIYRPDRERAIIQNLLSITKEKGLKNLNKSIIEAIFYEIFAIARNIETPQKIAFLGPIGSYTHQAAENRFGPLSAYLPLTTISAVFEALQRGNAKYGVIPLENNTNGMVGETIDNLAKHNFKIINEIILPIHHSFATKEKHINDIKRIYSKDIAFGQCSNFLQSYQLHEIEHISVSSTAFGAKLASSESGSAAICSEIATKLYNLPIMFANIENHCTNQTRFVIISDFTNEKGQNDKTSIFVSMKDFGKAGALFGLLQDFKDESINITKIDSRPIQSDGAFHSGFYMDFYGHKDDESVKRLFDKRGDEIKWLGSYPAFV